MKEIIACLLSLMRLPIHVAAQEKRCPSQQIIAIPAGDFVGIRTTGKERILGRICAVTDKADAIETIAAWKPETVRAVMVVGIAPAGN